MTSDSVYASLEPIAYLLGTWRGSGRGTWPSSGDFAYEEEMSFELGGGGEDFPFYEYSERAWNADSGETLHSERGFWILDDERLTVALAHPIAATEISEGSVSGEVIELAALHLASGTSGLQVAAYTRRYEVRGDEMTYEQQLAAGDVSVTRHLTGTLART